MGVGAAARRWLVVGLVGVLVGGWPSAVVGQPGSGELIEQGGGVPPESVVVSGSAVVPVVPMEVFAGRPGSGRDVVVTGVGRVPVVGVGAVVLQVEASAAGVAVSASGSDDEWVVGGRSGTVVVRVGVGGKVRVVGGGRVALGVLGWVPETSDLTLIGTQRVFASEVGAGASRQFRVRGGGVPGEASAVLVRVVASGGVGSVGLAPAGGRVRTAVLDYSDRVSDAVVLVPVGRKGKVTLKALAGPGGRFQVEVLGWVAGDAVGARNPEAVFTGRVGSGRAKKVKVTDGRRSGAVWARVTVLDPSVDGSLWVWSGRRQPEGAALGFTAGGTVGATVLVTVPKSGKVNLRASTEARVRVDVFATVPRKSAERPTTMVLKAATVLAGPSDVVRADSGSVRLRAGTDLPRVGGHLVVAPGPGSSGVLGRVTSVTPDGDTTVVGYTPAAVYEAFDQFKTSYRGPLGPRIDRPAGRTGRSGLSDVLGVSLSDLVGGECEVEGLDLGSFDYGIRGVSVEFDFDLSERMVRFVVRGTGFVEASLQVEATVSCTWSQDFPYRVPVGWLGIKLGAGLSISVAGGVGQVTLGAQAPLALGFEWHDGDTNNLSSVNFDGDADADASELNVSLTPFVTLGIGAVIDPQVVDPVIDIRLGMEARFAPHDRYFGPRCYALTLRPVIDITATLHIALFPDPEFNLAQISTEPAELWRGPCITYTGSVNLERTRVPHGFRTRGRVALDRELRTIDVKVFEGVTGVSFSSGTDGD